MARYDYKCTSCGTTFEVEHPMGSHPEVTCPSCGAEAAQVFGASGIVFNLGAITINLSGLAIAAIVGIVLNAILPGKDYTFGTDLQGDTAVNFKV